MNLKYRVPKQIILMRDFINAIPYYGKGRWCPVCGRSSSKFGRIGRIKREEAKCMHCGALERHRFTWLYFISRTDLFDGRPKKVLHVAPERCFETRLIKFLRSGYITADLFDPRAMVKMDITNIQYPDEYFDVIYCSHVLEHVQEDKKALNEFYRVLKVGGWAILNVPITNEFTVEDPLIIDRLDRINKFGHPEHVRRYGPDYFDRLLSADFHVDVIQVADMFENIEIIRMGLTPASGEIFFCTKPNK